MASCISSAFLYSFLYGSLLRFSQPLPYSAGIPSLSGCVAVIIFFSPPLPCAWVCSYWLRFFAFSLAVALSSPSPSHSAFLVCGLPSASPVPLPNRLVLTDSLCYAFRFSLLHWRLPVLLYLSPYPSAPYFLGFLLPLQVFFALISSSSLL